MKIVMLDIFLMQMQSIQEIFMKCMVTQHFYLIQKKIRKIEKLVCGIEDKEKYVIHINALKQALNHGLRLINVHRGIQFNQEAWLEPYIDMNTELRKKAKNDFEKDFFRLMNNSVFGKKWKMLENIRILNQ